MAILCWAAKNSLRGTDDMNGFSSTFLTLRIIGILLFKKNKEQNPSTYELYFEYEQ